MGRKKKSKLLKLALKPETTHTVLGTIFVLIGVLIIVSFTGQGALMMQINEFLKLKIGFSALFVPFVFVSAGMMLFKAKWAWSRPNVFLGAMLMLLGVLGAFKTGEIGAQTFANVADLISPVGTFILFFTIAVIGFFILSQFSLNELAELKGILFPEKNSSGAKKKEITPVTPDDIDDAKGFSLPKLSFFGKKDKPGFSINSGNEISQAEEAEVGTAIASDKPNVSDDTTSEISLTDSTLQPNADTLVWEYPPLSLLSNSEGGEANRGDVKQNADIIEQTLASFGIKAEVKEVNYGPAVTQYALQISQGTKLSKITGLSTDLALALASPGGQVRIEAPIAGRSLVGVEVPNYSAQYVTLKKMLGSKAMKKHPSKLATALGINVAGQPVIMDIAKMPHILIAGATGSGKSVAVNTFITSILYRSSPSEVKFILVDPKRVELTGYNDIPHLLTPVIVEPKKVVSALKWATDEMDRRYKQLAEVGVRNITGFNELAGYAAMPNIVIVIDELADIMLFAPGEVEESITRIAQMARAVGIHLVLATQRPSVDVITGLIKANIPGRICFNVSSMTDSRVVLDSPGAEKLLGKGDMLFQPPDQAKPLRVQGTYVSDQEIKSLIDFIKSQGQAPSYEENITKYKVNVGGGSGVAGSADDRDELFDEVVHYVAQQQKGSSSMIQRKFSVGYNRAARILDQLYASGLVGPQEGSKPRDVNMQQISEYMTQRSAE
ncbi:MAG: DNA translocase FtsK [Candidatus Pacebacteria bacterium]|nr:DNA translocase FtsK [Candidatus Paceibacterota bacterium]PIR63622.1 MAG: DNA translocase FtsK [Candidatus Pacebacteria bacterium CG10_big_fil_rev_8_21_14_0_10_40_26]PIZ78724.1 MAG: DNA translocase FtsK [Candidatus Pacebacteria bacterium CG_4_10_14_0_2_um_filter_40_20]PJA68424.1 MAG: DNA translocase FtsK [Candidatus Pacebacteria bacterium CG_4_9_14_3_um_filter_40_12]PJC41286.1 MAG: DNA translocase FtsK [Candidatus Pacebacteria bacterium CG_4_9_14_0_2_um_filter_40_15]